MARAHFKNAGNVWVNHDRDRELFVKDWLKKNFERHHVRAVLEFEVANNHWHQGREIVEVRLDQCRLFDGNFVFTKASGSSKVLQKWHCRCQTMGCRANRYATLNAQGTTFAITDGNEHDLHTEYSNTFYNPDTGRLQEIEDLLEVVEKLETNGCDLKSLFRGEMRADDFELEQLEAFNVFAGFEIANKSFEEKFGDKCNGKYRLYARFFQTVTQGSSLRKKLEAIRYVDETSTTENSRIQSDLQTWDRALNLLRACGSSDSYRILIKYADLVIDGSKKRAHVSESMIINAFCRTNQYCPLINIYLGHRFKKFMDNDLTVASKATAFLLLRGLVNCKVRVSDFTPKTTGAIGIVVDRRRLAAIRRDAGLVLEVENVLDEIRELAKSKDQEAYRQARFLLDRLFISEDVGRQVAVLNETVQNTTTQLNVTGSSTKSPDCKKLKKDTNDESELKVVYERVTKKPMFSMSSTK
ncbi:hypothetical protein M3Y98_00687500 [Aphelenchoides besseyi]|nr:hypothetical protein M3Y98_00687500 [Aphelenchoides besseyi]KAI6209027.1 hypothetical protein M3Y96_00177500 [Aphelenchoides besseyi]